MGYEGSSCSQRRAVRAGSLAFATWFAVAACGAPIDLGVGAAEEALITPPASVFAGTVVATTGHPGWTEGHADVSPQGSATYDIPLWVPPGRGGMQPQLALAYDHRSGNGVVGQGWVLRGLSSITRCGDARQALGTGQIEAVVTNTALDTLCLDGEPLVTDGVDGTYRVGGNGLIRVTRMGSAESPTGFVATLADGRRVTFGVESDALVSGTSMQDGGDGVADDRGAEVAIGWLTSRIEDRAGNYISVRYLVTFWGPEYHYAAEHRPVELRYTGNLWRGDPGTRVVRFVYETAERPDVAIAFQAGVPSVMSQRISEIQMLAPTDTATASTPVLMRRYQLGYTTSPWTRRSLLSSVTECDGGGVCREPIAFDYTEPTATEYVEELTPLASYMEPLGGDVDGDGAHDFYNPNPHPDGTRELWSRRADGTWLVTPVVTDRYCQRFVVADREGDGAVEALCFSSVYGPPDATISEGAVLWGYFEYDRPGCSIGDRAPCPGGSLYVRAEDPSAPVTMCPEGYGNRSYGLADLNGDGRPDPVIGCATRSGGVVRTAGATFSTRAGVGGYQVGSLAGDGGHDLLTRNGDGKYEVLTIVPSDRPGSAYEFARIDTAVAAPDPDEADCDNIFIDANGDGLVDVVSLHGEAGPTVRLNVGGARFAAAQQATTSAIDYSTARADLARVGDFNGDGLSDFVVPIADGAYPHIPEFNRLWLHLSEGTRFRAVLAGDAGHRRVGAPRATFVPMAPAVGDPNGDGIADLAPGYTSRVDTDLTGTVWRRWPASTPDLLRQVRRSAATVEASFDFGRVGADATYCTYPAACASAPLSVVRFTDRNGVAYAHDYAGSRSHAVTGSWLGFSQHTIREEATGRTSVAWFDNRTTDQSGEVRGVGLPRLTLTYAPHASGPNRYYVSITENVFGTHAVGPARVRTLVHTRVREWEDVALGVSALPDYLPSGCMALPVSFGGDVLPACPLSVRSAFPSDAAMREAESMQTYAGGVVRWASDTIAGVQRTVTSSTPATAPSGCSDFPAGFPGRVDVTSTDIASGASATRSIVFAWNCDGTLAASTRDPDGDLRLTTTYERHPDYALTTAIIERDRAGEERRTELQYDEEWIHPRGELDAAGLERGLATHPGLGAPVWSRDETGVTSTMRYDGFGRLRFAQTGTMSRSVRYEQVPGNPGSLTAYVDEAGQPSRSLVVDWRGRVLYRRNETLEGWVTSGVTYDVLGRVQRVEVPHFLVTQASAWLEYSYDALDRVTQVRTSAGATTSISRQRLAATVTDPRGHTSTRVHDGAGRVLSVTDAAAEAGQPPTVMTFAYGPFGLLRSTRDHRGTEWSQVHDAYGNLTRSVDPDAGTTVFVYDAFGQVKDEFDAAGRLRAHHEYDSIGRPTASDSVADGVTRFVWDTIVPGRLSSASRDVDGVSSHFRYDSLGRATGQTQFTPGSTALALDWSYDASGRLSNIVYPYDGTHRPVVRYAYADATDGSLASVTYDGRPIWRATDRDALNRVEREVFGNSVETSYVYDSSTTRLASATTRRGTASPLQDLVYGYDAEGNVMRREDRSLIVERVTSYEYDALDRMRFARVMGGPAFEYRYDDLGNMTYNAGVTQAYTESGAPHRLSRVGSAAVGHDDRGRMRAGVGWSATYTDFGLPRTLTRSGATTTFRYDAFGSRAEKRSSTSVTTYIGGVYQRRVASGVTSHVMDIHADSQLVAQVTVTGASTRTSYIHSDYLGSPTLITDESGAVAERYSYRPYGERRRVSATGSPLLTAPVAGRDGFTGHEHDDELGLVNMRGRMYDPAVGRFVTPDPLIVNPLSRQTYNAYSYVFNNPATMTDPSGYGGGRPDRHPDPNSGYEEAAAAGILALAAWIVESLSQDGGGGDDFSGRELPQQPVNTAPPPEHASRIVDDFGNWLRERETAQWHAIRTVVDGAIEGVIPYDSGDARLLQAVGIWGPRPEDQDEMERDWRWQTARFASAAYGAARGAQGVAAGVRGGGVGVGQAVGGVRGAGALSVVPALAIRVPSLVTVVLGAASVRYGGVALDAATDLYTLATGGGPEGGATGDGGGGGGGTGSVSLTAGKNFRDHFVTKRSLVQEALGVQVGRLTDGGGARLLAAMSEAINSGVLVPVGQGTIRTGGAALEVYRGRGITVLTTTAGEWVTTLRTGQGMDLAIQMLR